MRERMSSGITGINLPTATPEDEPRSYGVNYDR